jgi:glycosyltransferase involved in cell wall biosynthesis
MMRVLFLNPFHSGSHAAVAEGLARHSRHAITLLTLSAAGGWRWRMRGAAVTFARRLWALTSGAPARQRFDLLLTTDLLDLATFRGLAGELAAGLPAAVYFHENQLTYPLPPGRQRDLSFAWTNYTSALAADALLFNSAFHRGAFLDALPGLVGRYHDHQELDLLAGIAAKAQVLHPGIDLARLDAAPAPPRPAGPPVILWNSRWEYDKQPEAFFAALEALEARGAAFRLIVMGEHIDPGAPVFVAARERFAPRLLHWGYAPDTAAYAVLLRQADVVVSTAIQECFGIALVEAMYCGCLPIAPRRLSYPEVIPAALHDLCLYDSQDELVAKLGQALAGAAGRPRADLRAAAARYDWACMAPRYDAALAQAATAGTAIR